MHSFAVCLYHRQVSLHPAEDRIPRSGGRKMLPVLESDCHGSHRRSCSLLVDICWWKTELESNLESFSASGTTHSQIKRTFAVHLANILTLAFLNHGARWGKKKSGRCDFISEPASRRASPKNKQQSEIHLHSSTLNKHTEAFSDSSSLPEVFPGLSLSLSLSSSQILGLCHLNQNS